MQKKKKIILFDIDYTLFDTDLYIDKFFPLLADELGIKNINQFKKIAKSANLETRKTAGFFDPLPYLKILLTSAKKPTDLKKLEAIFFENTMYSKSVYGDAITVLENLFNKHYMLGVLSQGEDRHQRQKIKNLESYFKKENIHIFSNKISQLNKVFQQYADKEIFLVDDNASVLEKAKFLQKNIITIWIKKTRKYEYVSPISYYKPDYTFTNLYDILSILK